MFDVDRAADNSLSIEIALALIGGGYFDYMGSESLTCEMMVDGSSRLDSADKLMPLSEIDYSLICRS